MTDSSKKEVSKDEIVEEVSNLKPEDVMTSLVGDLIRDDPKAAPLVFDQNLEEEEKDLNDNETSFQDNLSNLSKSILKLDSNNLETTTAEVQKTTFSATPTSTTKLETTTTDDKSSTLKDEVATTTTETSKTTSKSETTSPTTTTTSSTAMTTTASTLTSSVATETTTNNAAGEKELNENVHFIESTTESFNLPKSSEINSFGKKVDDRFESVDQNEEKWNVSLSSRNVKSTSTSSSSTLAPIVEEWKRDEAPTFNNDERERGLAINASTKIEDFDALIRVQSKVQENVSSNFKDDFRQEQNTLIDVDNIEGEKTFQIGEPIENEVDSDVKKVFRTKSKLLVDEENEKTKEEEAQTDTRDLKTDGETELVEAFSKIETDSNVLTIGDQEKRKRERGERERERENPINTVKENEIGKTTENAEWQTGNDLKFETHIHTHSNADKERNENTKEEEDRKTRLNEKEDKHENVEKNLNQRINVENAEEEKITNMETKIEIEMDGTKGKKVLKTELEMDGTEGKKVSKIEIEIDGTEGKKVSKTELEMDGTEGKKVSKTEGQTDWKESLWDLKPERSKAFSEDEKLTNEKETEKIPKIFQRLQVDDVEARREFKSEHQVTIQ